MAWQIYADKHVNAPLLLVEIGFNSGTRYYSNDFVRVCTGSGAIYGTFLYGDGTLYGDTGASCIMYKGKILDFPHIRQSIGDIDRTYEKNKIILIFDDTDYEFRGLEESEATSFKNRSVRIMLGFAEEDCLNKLTIFNGYIDNWQRLDNLQFSIEVEEFSRNLNNIYPDKVVEITDYANAHSSAMKGAVIPIPYGAISAQGASDDGAFGHSSLPENPGLLFVDTTQDAEIHLVGRQAAAITVDRVYIDGVLKTEGVGNDYTISTQVIDSQTHTEIHWNAGVRPTADNTVTADITFGTRKPVEGIKHFLENFCGYSSTNFNTTSYNAARAIEDERSYDFAGALFKEETLKTILDRWRYEFELDIYWNKDGEVCFNYLKSSYATPNHYQDLRDILIGFNSDPNVDQIINYIRVGYKYHYAKNYNNNYYTYQNTASQTKYGETNKIFPSFKWIREAATVADIAMRKVMRQKDPLVFDVMTFPLKAYSDDLTDLLHITHFEGVGASGYNEKLFQIRSMAFDLDNFTNEMLLEDASNWMGSSCILGDDTVLPATWTSASGAEMDYCYMCDPTTGEFSDGKPGKQLYD